MTRSDVPLCSWNSLAPLAGTTGLYLSRSVSAKQSGWLQNLWTDAGTCVHCTNMSAIPAAVTSDLKQLLIVTRASISQNVIDEAAGQWRKRLHANMKAKWHHFEHLLNWNLLLFRANTLHNQLFSQPPTVYRGKLVVSRYFHRSHLKSK